MKGATQDRLVSPAACGLTRRQRDTSLPSRIPRANPTRAGWSRLRESLPAGGRDAPCQAGRATQGVYAHEPPLSADSGRQLARSSLMH